MQLNIKEILDSQVTISWDKLENAASYRVLWADADYATMKYKMMAETKENEFTLKKATHVPHYFKVEALDKNGEVITVSDMLETPVKKIFHEHMEKLNRGLVAVPVKNGIFLSWRLMLEEVKGYCETGLTGTDFVVYKNGKKLALVTDSTNYLDKDGTADDEYSVAAVRATEKVTDGAGDSEHTDNTKAAENLIAAENDFTENNTELPSCPPVKVWAREYLDIPIQKPEGGVTPAGDTYEYSANDMSVADVDGDGEYEYIVKWDPSNAHDVSIKGYTGKNYLDCYKLDGTLLWRLDMGVNIRAGAHYTQFMVYDFNLDGKAEMVVKTAPGTKMTTYNADGTVKESHFITMPAKDVEAGVTHESNFVCSATDYRNHLVEMFKGWSDRAEVKNGEWPSTLEECFETEKKYDYPLSDEDASKLVDYFIYEYAPKRSAKNRLDQFEGFIYEGPEYLTMFGGDGAELQTIPFKMDRVDDGLLWGDYAMPRIEPCNRVDRFLSGVAYLDGERPYAIICRGYYTRSTIVAYDFFENKFHEVFSVDSGFVPMTNPFCDKAIHGIGGIDPVYGALAGQGNHSLATADVDGDGCMEIIYGAAVIDHDGSLLYSSFDTRPDGVVAKLGHGDAMHVAKIDPDRPGFQIFNVFEGGASVPYGYALRDAETGKAFWGEYATEDLGRCMIGKVNKDIRGWQAWVKDMYDCDGNKLADPLLGTNQSIKFAADLTTQVTDGVKYIGTTQPGVINDNIHGIMLEPENTMTNNGTKGNPCLIADIFGDFREEILLRTKDSSAIRIYTSTEVAAHKLFTLMHDTQYRCGVAWQNNCYNQPGYTKFYYGSDMDFKYVLPGRFEKHN